jgi:hypothetical protein
MYCEEMLVQHSITVTTAVHSGPASTGPDTIEIGL